MNVSIVGSRAESGSVSQRCGSAVSDPCQSYPRSATLTETLLKIIRTPPESLPGTDLVAFHLGELLELEALLGQERDGAEEEVVPRVVLEIHGKVVPGQCRQLLA